jgi:hypothetical protein
VSFDIEFEEPPEHILATAGRGTPGKYLQFAIALREHPGKWAVLPSDGQSRTEKGAKATAQNIRRGVVKGFKRGEYDAITDGQKIWVQFKGEPTPKGTPVDEEPEDDADEDTDDDTPQAGRAVAPLIRAWAVENGYDVPERGRMSRAVVEAYWKEHGGQPPSHVRVVR